MGVPGHNADAEGAARARFLARLVREVRTPIDAVLGHSHLLEMGLMGQQDFLERLRASGAQLLKLLDDVLALSRAESGRMTLAQERASAGDSVAPALSLNISPAEAKGVRLHDRTADAGGLAYVGDARRVREILANLIANAIARTPAAGVVTVRCATAAGAPPQARLQGYGPWVSIRIEDSGSGIAPEEQPRVFEPFHRSGPRTTGARSGTGLELAISRCLARLMGGDITVESEPGAGSAFTLWLPAAVDGEPAPANEPSAIG
jgi:signal transduction histidine kinase